MKTNIGIIGGRNYTNYQLLREIIDNFIKSEEIDLGKIISGGAPGADKLGAKYAKENNFELEEFLADWERYGKSAGYIRNIDIVKNSDVIFAFWDGQSKGTKHSIDLAKENKKRLIIITY